MGVLVHCTVEGMCVGDEEVYILSVPGCNIIEGNVEDAWQSRL